MITELPEQLLAQAEFLIRNSDSNEANVRRAVSTAYYALFHLLIRDSVANWKHDEDRARLARTFDHRRMRDASAAILKEIGRVETQTASVDDPESASRFRLSTVAEAFLDLQQARHKADYDVAETFQAIDAATNVSQARLTLITWNEVGDEPLAQRYLYSLLFKDKS